MTIHVTRTGRALSAGRVTRTSYSVAKGHTGRPLPMHLQCHPKALTPTSVNPGCVSTTTPWAMWFLCFKKKAESRGAAYFTERTWPKYDAHSCTLYVQGKLTFTTNDLNKAIGWKRAAASYGVAVAVHYETKGE